LPDCSNFSAAVAHAYIYFIPSLFPSSLAAPGETVEIAEEMAARDALRRLFRTDDARTPLPMGDESLAQLDVKRDKPNQSVKQWSERAVGNLIQLK
jgi:hypothetical protein